MSTDPVREALEYAAAHFSSDWPERCQLIVLKARAALAQPAREPLTSERVFEIWERAAQIDISGRVNELIRTKDAQCVIRAIVMAAQEKP